MVIGDFKEEHNRRHRHSALGYLTLAEYAARSSHTHHGGLRYQLNLNETTWTRTPCGPVIGDRSPLCRRALRANGSLLGILHNDLGQAATLRVSVTDRAVPCRIRAISAGSTPLPCRFELLSGLVIHPREWPTIVPGYRTASPRSGSPGLLLSATLIGARSTNRERALCTEVVRRRNGAGGARTPPHSPAITLPGRRFQ